MRAAKEMIGKNPTVYIDGLFAKCVKNLLVDTTIKLLKLWKTLHLGCLAEARLIQEAGR